MVYKNAQLLMHSTFMFSMVKMLRKGEVGVCALNSHGNYIVDHGKSWKNHGILFMNFCGNPHLVQINPLRGSVKYNRVLMHSVINKII